MPVFDLVGALFGTSLAAGWAWWSVPDLHVKWREDANADSVGSRQVFRMLGKVRISFESETLRELTECQQGLLWGSLPRSP